MEDIKNFILDKAKDRFDRFGYRKTTMDELSRDCKISKRTIYELFHDKEDLFTNLMIRENHTFQKVLFEQIATIDDPLEQITQLIRTAIRFFNEDHFLTRLLKADEQLFSAFISKKYNTMVRQEVISLISDILCKGKQQGLFREVDEELFAYAGVRLFEAFSYMRTMEFSGKKGEEAYYTEVLIDLIVHSIVKK